MHPYDAMTEPELKAEFVKVGNAIKSSIPPATGFVCVVAPFGSSGVAQYVGNCRRDDALKWMKETIARWESSDYIPR